MKARTPWYLKAAMAVGGVAAAVASFYFLAALAKWAGWEGWARWLFPLSIDATAIASLVVWMKPGFPEAARRFARMFALSAILASAGGNIASHLVVDGVKRSGWDMILVVAVAAVPALAVAGMVEIAVLIAGPLSTKRRSTAAPKVTTVVPESVKVEPPKVYEKPAELADDGEPQPVVLHSVPTGESLGLDPDADDREWVIALNERHKVETGREIGKPTLMREMKKHRGRGMNSDEAARLLREVKAEAAG
jgi:hypothetical protein